MKSNFGVSKSTNILKMILSHNVYVKHFFGKHLFLRGQKYFYFIPSGHKK